MKYREPEIIVPELEKLVGSYTTPKWSAKDEATLKRYYRKVPHDKLAKHLGRTVDSLTRKAQRMGVAR